MANFSQPTQNNSNVVLIGVSILIIIAVAVALMFTTGSIKKNSLIKEYQAVFLTNGQVYFGHLDMSMEFYELTDIYYLQVNQDLQIAEDGTKPDLSLIKLGEELHGPTDRMLINKDQVLFIEDIADDSKVMKAIADNKAVK